MWNWLAMKNDALAAAYRATTYRIFLPAGVIDLRLDAANPDFQRWLNAEGITEWAIITAHNPGSQPLAPEENAERQSQLECLLLEKGLEPFSGENVAAREDWPVEETCLVAGISVKDCTALAQQFGQNAVIIGGRDAVPHLLWLNEGENE